jgi:hypothetical protein
MPMRLRWSCRHRRDADLEALIAGGHGDVPLLRLRWRCNRCGAPPHVQGPGATVVTVGLRNAGMLLKKRRASVVLDTRRKGKESI